MALLILPGVACLQSSAEPACGKQSKADGGLRCDSSFLNNEKPPVPRLRRAHGQIRRALHVLWTRFPPASLAPSEARRFRATACRAGNRSRRRRSRRQPRSARHPQSCKSHAQGQGRRPQRRPAVGDVAPGSLRSDDRLRRAEPSVREAQTSGVELSHRTHPAGAPRRRGRRLEASLRSRPTG